MNKIELCTNFNEKMELIVHLLPQDRLENKRWASFVLNASQRKRKIGV